MVVYKIKHGSLLLLIIVFLFACKNKTHGQTANDENHTLHQPGRVMKNISDTTYLDVKGNSYKYLGVIPDSLRTPEQKKLIKLIGIVSYKYMSVENNHMVFELTKEQYVAKGIPGRYYDLLLQNIRDNNLYIDSNGIKDVNKMVKQMQDELALPQQNEPK